MKYVLLIITVVLSLSSSAQSLDGNPIRKHTKLNGFILGGSYVSTNNQNLDGVAPKGYGPTLSLLYRNFVLDGTFLFGDAREMWSTHLGYAIYLPVFNDTEGKSFFISPKVGVHSERFSSEDGSTTKADVGGDLIMKYQFLLIKLGCSSANPLSFGVGISL